MRNIEYLKSNGVPTPTTTNATTTLSINNNNSNNQLGTSPLNNSTTSTTSSCIARKRKLILHFDQHNTIQVACTLPGRRITVEEGLNNFLTSVVWGKEVEGSASVTSTTTTNNNNDYDVDDDQENTRSSASSNSSGGGSNWKWVSNEPRLTKPPNEPDAITYFKYLEKKIVKSPEDRARLKQLTCRFVHEEPGRAFKEYFDLYLESLIYSTSSSHKTNEEGVETAEDEQEEQEQEVMQENLFYYTSLGPLTNGGEHVGNCGLVVESFSDCPLLTNGHSRVPVMKKLPPNTIPAGDPCNKSLYHLILPEFFDMIRRLQKANREFAIVLRTMGIDSHNFLETIKPMFEGKHRLFRDLAPLKINTSVGQIKRNQDGSIELHMDNEVYTSDAAIYAKLSSLEGISAIRDDFAYWQSNDYSCYAAKPLWIDLNDMEHHHIIFDDNIRLDSTIDDCIVNIRLRRFNPSNGQEEDEFESIDFESYQLFEKSSILQPDLIKLLNPHARSDSTRNYYYELVRRSEAVYDRLLEDRDKLAITTAVFVNTDKENECEKACEETNGNNENNEQQTDIDSLNDLVNMTKKNNGVKIPLNPTRRNSADMFQGSLSSSVGGTSVGTVVGGLQDKRFRNIKLNRSFSVRLEEAEKQAGKENEKSTICLIS